MIPPNNQSLTTSVIICTHLEERTLQLLDCLESIFAQTQQPDEVIVVVDGDLALAKRLTRNFERVTIGCLPHKSGVSAARNFGAQMAATDIIAFLDDDATADPNWLKYLCGAIRDSDVIGVSGRSIPCWEAPRQPFWFPEEFYWAIGCSYKGMPSAPSAVRNVYGGCAAFRRWDFLELGGFNPARGRHGTDMSGGEEAEFSMRASLCWPNRYFMFEPSALIFHRVPRSRSSMNYLIRRCFAEGKAKSAIVGRSTISQNAGFSPEVKFAASIPLAALRLLWTGLTGRPSSFSSLYGLLVASTASSIGVLMGFPKRSSREFSTIEQRDRLPASSEVNIQKFDLVVAPTNAEQTQKMHERPARVLVVTARFLPELGGIETHISEITRRMARRGDIDITILTTDRSGKLPEREAFEGLTVLRCRSYPRNKDYYIAPRIYSEIRNGNYDLIHCQGIHTAVPVIAMLAARRRGLPYVVTLHTGGHSSKLRNRLRSLQWRAVGPLLKGAVIIVAVSRFEQQMFQEKCGLSTSRLRVIRNGGDLSVTGRIPNRIPGRIVSSGRLERYKGHQRVVEALPIVRQTIANATVHILGSGPYNNELQALIQRLGMDEFVTIEYIAPDDRERMAESLGQASVFAALSEYEAHPVAVMEALALRIPAVGLDTAGIGDLVEDGLVMGVPKDASPAIIARALIAAMNGSYSTKPTRLPTWESATADLAAVYSQAVETARGNGASAQTTSVGSL